MNVREIGFLVLHYCYNMAQEFGRFDFPSNYQDLKDGLNNLFGINFNTGEICLAVQYLAGHNYVTHQDIRFHEGVQITSAGIDYYLYTLNSNSCPLTFK